MIKNILICLFALTISGCANTNKTAKLVSKLRTELKVNYGINNGEIAAKFDLASLNKKADSLFASNYGSIVNDKNANSKFLSNFAKNYRGKYFLQFKAYSKLNTLCATLLKIDEEFNLFSKSLKKTLFTLTIKFKNEYQLSKNDKEYYYEMLVSLYNTIKSLPLFVPIENPVLTSKFGLRARGLKKKKTFHAGLDLAGKNNCKIYASGDGVVEAVVKAKGYGNMVVVSHDNGIKTRYAHMSMITVFEGDKVLQGQSLGNQGNSGTSTGPHLHMEVILKGKAVDPMLFIGHSL